ncbi:MAG: CHAT domain-containing protein [Gammaproteobacteria bacterium]|jgi:CHAT domain-containing protein/tetratricopeptide (TPR) repeat protein
MTPTSEKIGTMPTTLKPVINHQGWAFRHWLHLVLAFGWFCWGSVPAVAATVSPAVQTMKVSLQSEQPSLNSKQQIGNKLLERGFYQDSVAYFRTLANQYRQAGDMLGEANTLFNLATAQRAIGMYGRAARSLEVASKLAKNTDDRVLEAHILSSLAATYLYAGKTTKAKPLFVHAKTKAVLIGDKHLEALILNDQGNMHAFEKDFGKAMQAYELSRYLAGKINDSLVAVRAQTNAALVLYSQQKFPECERYLVDAIEQLQAEPDTYEKSYAAVKLAETVQKLLPHTQPMNQELALSGVNILKGALNTASQLNNHRLTSHALGVLAGIYAIADQQKEALVLNEKAIFHAQQADSQDLLYKWEWQAGQVQKSLGHLDEAIQFYRFAKDSLQPIRHELTQRNLGDSLTFKETQGGVYLELADLLLQKSSVLEDKKSVADYLLEARNTVELQKEAELQDYFKDSCVVNADSRETLIDEAIADNTAVIYPILLPDRTELLVSYSSGIQRYTVARTEAEVTRQVRDLRIKLEKRKTRDYLPHAKALYDWLIAPMEADFQRRGINTLVVVADQSLRTIPLSVLYDGEGFLVNKYAIATTPGLKLTDPTPLHRDNMKILLSGLSEPVQGFPALQYVQGELEEIQDLYVGELLMNRDFVTSSIKNALQNTTYSVTHIASHSVFTGDVDGSYILTYDDRITVDQLGQYAALSRNRDKPIELLTLSACETAAGDDRAALGLAGVAVKSGARSALATLWAINDQASALLVTEFYRQLQDKNLSKAQALQRAQTKLMQNVRYRHPGYWSPFLLIGNWL